MHHKTSPLSLALSLGLLGGALVVGAAGRPAPALAAPTRSALAAATLTDRDVARLAAPEPGAAAADYRVRAVTLRLFGTQGSGTSASATLADTASWATHTYALGQTIGRSLVLSAVQKDSIDLRDSLTGAVSVVRAGADVSVRLVEHAFDVAAVDRGEHQWSVRAAVLGQILARYGVGATATEVTLHNTRAARLSAVKPGSALARLGFREGDLLVAVNRGASGQPMAAPLVELPAALCAAVTQPSSQTVLVTLLRGGARFDIAYAVE
jgi:hypothetical protein